MTTALITAEKTKPGFFPAVTPKTWDACNECFEDVDPAFAHIVIYTEKGQLLAGTECGQRRFQFAAAGHLALAGVRIGPGEDDGACQLLDPEQIDQAVAALNAAGADVTVVED